MQVGDKSYTFSRGKSGAEVLIDNDVFVTGQVEVSNFAAELLGTDASTAAQLMMAGQGSLRGVLDQGPKATSTLIENLSNLDIIEEIIEKAQTNLQVGNTAILNERLKNAEETLATTVKPVAPVAPNLTLTRQAMQEAGEGLAKASDKAELASQALLAEVQKREKRDNLTESLGSLEAQLKDLVEQQAAEVVKSEAKVSDPAPLRAKLLAAEDHENRAAGFLIFRQMRVVWAETFGAEEFETLFRRAKQTLSDIKQTIWKSGMSVKMLEPQVATSSICPSCGQDTAHLEHVKVAQAGIKQDLEDARRELAEAEAALPLAQENVDEGNAIVQANEDNLKLASRIATYVEIDQTVMPARITWIGAETGIPINTAGIRKELQEVESAIVARDRALAKVEALQESCDKVNAKQVLVQDRISNLLILSDEDFAALVEADRSASESVTVLRGIVAICQIEIDVAQQKYDEAKAIYDLAASRIEDMTKTVAQLKEDIETTEFNNLLIKKLRAARPIIANKLWSLVLATVSTLFSQMRGETSVVTKGKDGFAVNGRPIESLSGSTLDILGLAVRCALIKTFVPGCPFIVLDEPAAACDTDRSDLLLGFVASSGFQQVIMVTHDETSETLATNLITL